MATLHDSKVPGLELVARGKVRDIYDLGNTLLFVVTDRVSAFDVVLPSPIPDKGKVLNQISAFWFDWAAPIVPNHLVTTDLDDMPESLHAHRELLEGRSSLVRRAEMFPVECVARGYLVGSGWKEYKTTGKVCGIDLPAGLREADRLPDPIFTPATKAQEGHDINISFDEMVKLVGGETAERLRALTMQIYGRAREFAAERGIIIADTKFEFGTIDGSIAICDEVLTPDSSRFWPKDEYRPGGSQPSFDKQYVRDYLETLDWDKTPPGPTLPEEVVEGTRRRYLEILEILTGRGLA